MIFITLNRSAYPFILLSKISNPSNLLYYHHLIPGHCCLLYQLHCIWTSHFIPVLLLSHTESSNLSFSKPPPHDPEVSILCFSFLPMMHTHRSRHTQTQTQMHTHTFKYIDTIYSKYCGSQPLRELYTILASRYSFTSLCGSIPHQIMSGLDKQNTADEMVCNFWSYAIKDSVDSVLLSWITCAGEAKWGQSDTPMEKPTWRRSKASHQELAPTSQLY